MKQKRLLKKKSLQCSKMMEKAPECVQLCTIYWYDGAQQQSTGSLPAVTAGGGVFKVKDTLILFSISIYNRLQAYNSLKGPVHLDYEYFLSPVILNDAKT